MSDRVALLAVLKSRPVAFHAIFSKMHKSTVAGVFLSQMFYWEPRSKRGGWLYKSQKEWFQETGLTRSEQETARKHLKASGILLEERARHPRTGRGILWFKIDYDAFLSMLESYIHGCGNPTSMDAGLWHPKMRESSKLSLSEITTETTIIGKKVKIHQNTKKSLWPTDLRP